MDGFYNRSKEYLAPMCGKCKIYIHIHIHILIVYTRAQEDENTYAGIKWKSRTFLMRLRKKILCVVQNCMICVLFAIIWLCHLSIKCMRIHQKYLYVKHIDVESIWVIWISFHSPYYKFAATNWSEYLIQYYVYLYKNFVGIAIKSIFCDYL